MSRVLSATLFCCALLVAGSDEATVMVSRLGYLFQSGSRTVRSLDGIPGASLVGPALEMGIDLADAAVPPDQSYVLAIEVGTRSAYVFNTATSQLRVIDGRNGPVDRIALSPTGSFAALYLAAEGLVEVVTGLPNTPVAVRETHIADLERIAISDDGSLLLVSSADPLRPILLFVGSSEGREIPIPGPVSALAFRPHSRDALIAPAGGITLVSDLDRQPRFQVFDELSMQPVALGFSRQGKQFFAAYGDGTIWRHDLASSESTVFSCPCIPTTLQRLNADSTFRLNEPAGGPVFLLDGANSRVVFVPAEGK